MNEFYLMITILAAASGGVTDVVRETAEMFGWNWKLFLSQVISFCIVAFLLQRFAYKPILALLEERRRKIEEGQINAEKIKKELAEALGILSAEEGVAFRATFVIDPDNIIQHVTVNGLNVGRNPAETLRILDALQTDELCPCNWSEGDEVLKPAA